jgi:hypothetical protein
MRRRWADKEKSSSYSNLDKYDDCAYNIFMKFEWDENKRVINLEKHHLDFRDAHLVFTDDAFVVEDPHDDYAETRYILQGLLHQQVVIISFTIEDDEIIRIISMRKATKREQTSYVKKRFG